jgi:large subunit ribosomal protein L29
VTAAELRDLSSAELEKKETELREELLKLRMRAATAQLPNPGRVRAVRRDIARILTLQRQRELAAQK